MAGAYKNKQLNEPGLPGWEESGAAVREYSHTKKSITQSSKKDNTPAKQRIRKKIEAQRDAGAKTAPSEEITDDVPAIWCPSSLHTNDTNSLWLKISARGIHSMAAWGRADKTLIPRNKRFTFYFLAPNELQEIIAHDWGPYESLAASIAEKTAWVSRMGTELRNLKQQLKGTGIETALEEASKFHLYGAGKAFIGAIANAFNKAGDSFPELVRQALIAASQAEVAKTRVDTALVYKNSERRKYDFVFHLADVGTPLYNEIIYPVRILQYLSSPSKLKSGGVNDLADIDFPFYFTLETYPIDFLKIDYAALTLVEPTWKGPYIGGYPSYCELHLSFVEIPPLWDSTFHDKGLVTVGTKTSKVQIGPQMEGLSRAS